MPINQNQKIALTPSSEIKLAVEPNNATLAQQTALISATPSPATLTLTAPSSDGSKVTVVVECADTDDTVRSIVDDAGNIYTLVASLRLSDTAKRFEVWSCDSAASMFGVIISTTNGGDITRALIGEALPLPQYAVAAIAALIAAQAVAGRPEGVAEPPVLSQPA